MNMACLHKYWLKEFARFFCIIQLIIIVLFVIIDYLSRLDKFLNSDLSLLGALGYVLLKVPFMFVQLTPASILLSTIVVFSLMNKNNELLAIRASGISIYLFAKPVLLAGGTLALLMFFLGETLIPISMVKANYIQNHVIKKNQNYLSARQDIWMKSGNNLVHINFFDPLSQAISGVTITTLEKDYSLKSRIDAHKGYYKDGHWILEDVIEQLHFEDTEDYKVNLYDSKQIDLALEPGDLGEILKKSDEMSFVQLREYALKVEEEGYDATVYRVDLNAKIALPFICIIMVLTGAATGIRSFARGNIPVAIATGVGITFLYWVMHGFCLSLGYGGILPPFISAWAANVFFLTVGVLNLVNSE